MDSRCIIFNYQPRSIAGLLRGRTATRRNSGRGLGRPVVSFCALDLQRDVRKLDRALTGRLCSGSQRRDNSPRRPICFLLIRIPETPGSCHDPRIRMHLHMTEVLSGARLSIGARFAIQRLTRRLKRLIRQRAAAPRPPDGQWSSAAIGQSAHVKEPACCLSSPGFWLSCSFASTYAVLYCLCDKIKNPVLTSPLWISSTDQFPKAGVRIWRLKRSLHSRQVR